MILSQNATSKRIVPNPEKANKPVLVYPQEIQANAKTKDRVEASYSQLKTYEDVNAIQG